ALEGLAPAHLGEVRARIAVGREEHAPHAAAEFRPVHALAGRGEQHLEDQLSHVRIVAALHGEPAGPGVDADRVSDGDESVGHVGLTGPRRATAWTARRPAPAGHRWRRGTDRRSTWRAPA